MENGASLAAVAPPSVAAEALALLERQGATLAVAESLTGGLVAAVLTGVPGASRTFLGSVTAYATDVKRDVLGVGGGLLAVRGAVDPAVAREMAQGVRDLLGARWGLATTGVAGPDPQDGRPVGTVYVAVAGPHGASAAALNLEGDRAAIRAETVSAVLEMLVVALTEAEEAPSGDITANIAGQDTEQHGRL
ncbi:CinA family protein [Streptomyces sp. PTM05]|uniref:CinA family protein n=1 Tax=Streptantibioticus parmotrematis TaxID=2873249 RepID=A0ABS7QVH1_9ACTN|nr:CinA family protein [Streptantibioticus parmotrematis]